MNIAAKILLGRWGFGGTSATLLIKANQDFVASNGEIIKAGIYRRVALAVAGFDLTIPLIGAIPPTTDSSVPDATYDSEILDENGNHKMVWLNGFPLSHIYSSPAAWADIFNATNPPGFQPGLEAISYQQAVIMLQGAVAGISGNTLAAGIGILAAATVTTILDSHVGAASPIEVLPLSDNITGRLRAFNRVLGVSFDVVSDNGADVGNFKWMIYP